MSAIEKVTGLRKFEDYEDMIVNGYGWRTLEEYLKDLPEDPRVNLRKVGFNPDAPFYMTSSDEDSDGSKFDLMNQLLETGKRVKVVEGKMVRYTRFDSGAVYVFAAVSDIYIPAVSD